MLGLMAVPLGVQFRTRGRNPGILIGLGVFLFYYVLLTAARTLVDSGWYPPVIGIWLPNMVIGAAALYMLRQANREEPIWLAVWINRLTNWLKRFPKG